MDILNPSEIAERLDSIIATLELDETTFYVAIEYAHQLRDELVQVLPGYRDD